MQFQSCAHCDHPNPVGANFCNHCGAALHLKPCRRCGSVAVAAARVCRACQLAFPHRPTINVDIPWVYAGVAPASPTAGGAAEGRTPAPTLPKAITAARLAASAEALAEAQRLIEKASGRSLAAHADPELVLPGGARDDDGAAGYRRAAAHGLAGTRATPRRARAAVAAGRLPQAGVPRPEVEIARPTPEPDDVAVAAAASRYWPLAVLAALALVATLALAYLLRDAGAGAAKRLPQTAAPQRMQAPIAPQPAPQAIDRTAASATFTATAIEMPKDETRAYPIALGTPPSSPAMTPSGIESMPVATPARLTRPPHPVVPATHDTAGQPSAPVLPPAAKDCRPAPGAPDLCGKANPRP